MARKLQWNSIALFSAVFCVALAARLLSLILDPMPQRDAVLYLFLAERWQETGDYAQAIAGGTIVPPLPLFTIVKLMDWGLPSEIAGRGIALFLGSMIPVLGYYISYKIFKDALIAGISAFFFIFHPVLISYSIQPLRENYYLFFLCLTIIAAINGIKNKRVQDWGLCGIFLAFSVYSRYESLELLIFIPLILFYLHFKKKITFKKTLSQLFVLFAANAMTTILLLSITGNDISFITKISKYSDKLIQQNNVRDYIQIDSKDLK